MKNLRTIFYFLAVFLLSSCMRDEKTDSREADIQFVMYTDTPLGSRVSTDGSYNTTFQSGDAVGVFAFAANEDGSDGLECYALNAQYVYDGSSWKPAKGNGIRISHDIGKTVKLNFYAYYPYDVNTLNYRSLERKIDIEQRLEEGYNASDLMVASTKGYEVDDDGGVVGLKFQHALSLVELKISGTDVHVVPNQSVRLLGMSSAYKYSLAEQKVIEVAPASDGDYVRMLPFSLNEGSLIYRAVVPPQTVPAEKDLIQEVDNTDATGTNYKLESDISFNAGKVRQLKIQKGDFLENIVIDNGEKAIYDWVANGNPQDLAQSGKEELPVEFVSIEFNENTQFPDYPYKNSETSCWSPDPGWWMISGVNDDYGLSVEVVEEYSDRFMAPVIKISPPKSKNSTGFGVGYNCPKGVYSGKYKLKFDAGIAGGQNRLYIIASSLKDDNTRVYFHLTPQKNGEIVNSTLIETKDGAFSCYIQSQTVDLTKK